MRGPRGDGAAGAVSRRGSRACSSVDRALGSGPKGRRFESCRARHCNLFRQGQRQSVRVGRRGQPDTHDLGACDRDPFVDSGALWRPWANPAPLGIDRPVRDFSRNSAACTHPRGAVWEHPRRPMGYPTPVRRRAFRGVTGSAEHSAVGEVERGTPSGQRDDVVDGEITRRMAGALVARAPVTVQSPPGAEDPSAEALPRPHAVQVVVPTAVRLALVGRAPTSRATRQHPADRAELHRWPCLRAVSLLTLVTLECTPVGIAMSVNVGSAAVYSPAVLRPWGQTHPIRSCRVDVHSAHRELGLPSAWLPDGRWERDVRGSSPDQVARRAFAGR